MKLGENTFYHGDCLFVLNHDVLADGKDGAKIFPFEF